MINKKNIIIAVVAILVILQFFGIDKTNPESDPSMDFIAMMNPPEDIKGILKTSCYDCHSYKTVYPWYTNITPLSWWIGDHIRHGRGEMNFSEWGTYSQKKALHKLEETYELVEEDEMPLPSYLWAHGDAELTAEQKERFISWVKSIPGVVKED